MKKNTDLQRRFFAPLKWILFLAVALSQKAWSQQSPNLDLLQASQGLPQVVQHLAPDSFVEVKTRRLAKAQVLWVNLELLQEMGIALPEEGLNAELEQKILDSFAYVVPRKSDSEEQFLPKEKTFYADRYGGDGLGYSEGSGRAAGAGLFQIKGIGRTPLADSVEPVQRKTPAFWNLAAVFQNVWDRFVDDNHSHGGATLREAMAEAVWGEILHKELPYGANRVVAIIGTSQAIGLMKNPRALIVRENSLRPAHYMRNENRPESEKKIETDRVEGLVDAFSNLPLDIPSPAKSTGPRIRQVIETMVDRVARKYGTEYAHSLFHGSTSPSNIDVTGKALDHGPLTALDGFTKAINVDYGPNGDFNVFLESILDQLIKDLRQTVSDSDKKYVPYRNEIRQIMRQSYYEQIQVEILWRAGLPPVLAKSLQKTGAGKKMAQLLLKVGRAGNEKTISTKKKVPLKTGTYDFNRVMRKFTQANLTVTDLADELSKEINDAQLISEVIDAWQPYQKELKRQAEIQQIEFSNLQKYIEIAAQQRNRTLFDLIRGGAMYVRQYIHMVIWTMTRLAPTISSYVNGMVKKNSRNFETFAALDLVLDEKLDLRSGSSVRKVYDGKTGQTKIQIVAFQNQGRILVNKSSLDVTSVLNPKATASTLMQMSLAIAGAQALDVLQVQTFGPRVVIDLEDSGASLSKLKDMSWQKRLSGLSAAKRSSTPLFETVGNLFLAPSQRGLACSGLL